jgi:hypothetical protein
LYYSDLKITITFERMRLLKLTLYYQYELL